MTSGAEAAMLLTRSSRTLAWNAGRVSMIIEIAIFEGKRSTAEPLRGAFELH